MNSTDVITVLGKRGSGKTTLGRKIQKLYPKTVIFDRLHEYAREKNAIFVSDFDQFAAAIVKTMNAKSFKIVFQFDIEATNHDEVFNQALRVLYYRGAVCIVIEEVHVFANSHFLPQWFREVLLTGRHRGLALIATSQRPAELHKTLLSQCHYIFCGSIHESNDLKYLSGFMGNSAAKLPNLKPFTFLKFTPGQAPVIVSNR